MKTAYNCFVEYFHTIKTGNYDPVPVERGIADYLENIGLGKDAGIQDAEKAAARELMRFRLMPEDTFVTFFDNYAARKQVERLLEETESLAFECAAGGNRITRDTYSDKINRFYSISADIAGDKRYSEWIEAVHDEVTANLKYAAGLSGKIPEKISERMLFANQYE